MNTQKPQVLVVDDEPIIREQLARALGTVGIACECAINGDDALKKFDTHHYPLVVTDLRMPQRHGHSLLLELHGRSDCPKIVALTGVTEPWMAEELRARGIHEVYYKPIDYFEFAGHLKRILDGTTSTSHEIGLQTGHNEGTAISTIFEDASESNTISRWMFTALRWLDWRRLENPPDELYHDVVELERSEQVKIVPTFEANAVNRELGIGIVLNDQCEPIDRPFKFIVRRLTQVQLTMVHTAPPQGPRLGAIVRASAKKRNVLLLKKLSCHPLTHGFDVTYQVLCKG